jgi:hypothetical protein
MYYNSQLSKLRIESIGTLRRSEISGNLHTIFSLACFINDHSYTRSILYKLIYQVILAGGGETTMRGDLSFVQCTLRNGDVTNRDVVSFRY